MAKEAKVGRERGYPGRRKRRRSWRSGEASGRALKAARAVWSCVVCKAGEDEGGFGEGGGQRSGEAEVDGPQGGVVHRRGVPAGG